MIFEFDDFSLDPDLRELKCSSKDIGVEPQVFDLLLLLIENRTRVVSKDEIVDTVWGGRIISESTLSSRITAARKSIGDTGSQQRLIRTIARKGFRFVGEVRERPLSRNEDDLEHAQQGSNSIQEVLWIEDDQREGKYERKPASVLICDLIASDGPNDPEDWHAIVANYHRRVKKISEAFGGTIAFPMSERLRVYFGFPFADEDDAERAVRCGLAIRNELKKFEIREPELYARPRVTIATSEIIVGNKKSIDGLWGREAIIGEATSIAARIQDSTLPGRVVVDDSTRRLMGKFFRCQPLNDNTIKLLNDKNPIWEVVGESKITNRFEALRPMQSAFIGREEELDFLVRRWDRARKSHGQGVLLVGEPGIGKSRLCKEFLDRITNEKFRCINYNCLAPYRDSALFPVISHLSKMANVGAGDPDDIKIKKLCALFGRNRKLRDLDVGLLAYLMSVPKFQSAAPHPNSPSYYREEILKFLLEDLKAECEDAPKVLLFEDLHWADPTSLDLLSRVVEATSHWPLMVLATARPEFSPPWPNYSYIRNVFLSRLGEEESADLLAALDADQSLSPDARKCVLDRSDGIPLFIEELTNASLEEPKTTVVREKTINDNHSPAVPVSVHASLLTRLDRLSLGKEIARIGSVIGPEFTYDIIRDVSELSRNDLEAALLELTDAHLLFQRGQAPHASYKFKHVLLRDAAYLTLAREERKKTHARILGILEKNATTADEILAQHASLSGQTESAISLWKSAAKQSSLRGAYREAASHLESAIAHAERSSETTEAQEQVLEMLGWLAFTWIASDGYLSKKARLAATRGVKLANQCPKSPFRFLPNYAQWTLSLATGPQERALAHIESLLSDLTDTDAHFHRFFANAFSGYSNLVVGRLKQADSRLETAKNIYNHELHNRGAHRFGHIPGPDLYFRISLVRALQGRLDSAQAYMRKALATCPQALDIHAEAQLLMKLGLVALVTRDHSRLLGYTRRLDEIAKEYPSLGVARIMSRLHHAMLEVTQGKRIAAQKFFQASNEYESEIMVFESAPRWVAQADLLLRADMLDEAKEAQRRADVLIQGTQEYMSKAELIRLGGVLALRDGDVSKAEKQLKRAIKLAKQQGALLWELRATTDLASIPDSESNLTAKRLMLSKILSKFSEGHNSADVQNAHSVLGIVTH